MTTPATHALIEDYLHRLRQAAQVLPPERRAELLDEITEHIAAARGEGLTTADEVRAVLRRLGEPADIVAVAREDTTSSPSTPRLTHEKWTLRTMTWGALLLPLVGWLAGVALLWASKRFQLREKLAGTLLLPGGAFGFIVLPHRIKLPDCRPGDVCGMWGTGTQLMTFVVTWMLISLVVPVVLWHRVRGRASREQPAATQPGLPALEVAGLLGVGLGHLVVPVIGPLAAVAVVARSRLWTYQEKAVALVLTTLSTGALGLLLVAAMADSTWLFERPWASRGLMLLTYGLPLYSAVFLYLRLRRTQTAVAHPPSYRL